MQIRPAIPDDYPCLAEIQRASVDALLRPLYDGDAIDVWLQRIKPDKFVRAVDQGEVILLAEENRRPMGFVSYCSQGELLGMWYVHAQHTDRGVGRALLEAAEQALREAGCNEAFTEASIYAKPVFQALGWTAIDEYEKPAFGSQFRVTRMTKSLTETA
ncbi:MAG: GNAT family N-acetyltransferase [Armatimonadetes bacterium]|nr:GNAT family N-acetyltransferase [Armatimonadota bacterium]